MIENFHNLHAGETALLVGNGPNLSLTPPERFPYPSIGTNTIHLYEGWRPTYYTAVDHRVMNEFGPAIVERFADIPKFVPCPDLDAWTGPNFYRWKRRAGEILIPGHRPNDPDALSAGMSFFNVMHVAMQLALYMGFTTVLMIGVQHRPDKMTAHFWGNDAGMTDPDAHNCNLWMRGYKELSALGNFLNISENTYVPADVIPRGDWRDWTTQKE